MSGEVNIVKNVEQPAQTGQMWSPIEPLSLFEILVRENADSLEAFLRAAIDDYSAADDLFQETMLVAWRKIGDYDRTRPFGAWLRGIAKNLVLAHYRLVARQVTTSDEKILEHLDHQMAQIDARPGDTLDERIEALHHCVEQLAPNYQAAVELHYRQERSTDWIAHHLATSRDAVQKRLQRARQLLADCLRRKGVLSSPGSAP